MVCQQETYWQTFYDENYFAIIRPPLLELEGGSWYHFHGYGFVYIPELPDHTERHHTTVKKQDIFNLATGRLVSEVLSLGPTQCQFLFSKSQ